MTQAYQTVDQATGRLKAAWDRIRALLTGAGIPAGDVDKVPTAENINLTFGDPAPVLSIQEKPDANGVRKVKDKTPRLHRVIEAESYNGEKPKQGVSYSGSRPTVILAFTIMDAYTLIAAVVNSMVDLIHPPELVADKDGNAKRREHPEGWLTTTHSLGLNRTKDGAGYYSKSAAFEARFAAVAGSVLDGWLPVLSATKVTLKQEARMLKATCSGNHLVVRMARSRPDGTPQEGIAVCALCARNYMNRKDVKAALKQGRFDVEALLSEAKLKLPKTPEQVNADQIAKAAEAAAETPVAQAS